MNSSPQALRSLRINSIALIIMLILQYILGMIINMYVSFPDTKVAGQLWEFAWSQIPIAAHIILAILILIGAIVLCIRSARNKNRTWFRASGFGLLFVFIAGFSGAQFIATQNDALSFVMSLSFIFAIGSYVWGLYVTKPEM